MPNDVQSIEEFLADDSSGHREAFNQLVGRLYGDLRELAHVQLRFRRPGETLNTTALVNELYCKLAEKGSGNWKDRDHFYAACATAMRHLLVDSARCRLSKKRGGGQRLLPLEEGSVAAEGDPEFIVELDRLMDSLAEHDARLVAVFECRYFGGFTISETARILSLSERTVERDWSRARGWFRLALKDASKQSGE